MTGKCGRIRITDEVALYCHKDLWHEGNHAAYDLDNPVSDLYIWDCCENKTCYACKMDAISKSLEQAKNSPAAKKLLTLASRTP